EDHPADGDVRVPPQQGQDRPPAADLDVIAVRPQAEHPVGRRGRFSQTQVKHEGAPHRGKEPARPGRPVRDTQRTASGGENASRTGGSSARPPRSWPPGPTPRGRAWRGRGGGPTRAPAAAPW